MSYVSQRSRLDFPRSIGLGSLVSSETKIAACLIAAIGFASGSIGLYRPTLAHALSLLFATLASECILWRLRDVKIALRGAVYLILGSGVLVPETQLAALAAVLFLLYAETSRRETPDRALLAWATAVATTVFITYVLSIQPYLWLIYCRACLELHCKISTVVVGKPLQMGPSYTGNSLLMCYLLVNCFRATQLPSWRLRFRALLTGFLPILFVPILYVVVGGVAVYFQGGGGSVDVLLNAPGSPSHYQSLLSYIFPNRVGLLFLPLLITSEMVFAPRHSLLNLGRRPPLSGRRFAISAGIVVGTTMLALLLTWHGDTKVRSSTTVYLWDPDNGLTRPPHPEYPGAGFFAKLPIILEALGYRVIVTDKESVLKEMSHHDILVLTNLQADFSDSLVSRVHNFVADGGGLLCLGDHTGFEAIRIPFNKVLHRYGITFNFDSAKPFGIWREGLLQFHDYVYVDPYPSPTKTRTDGIGTGASLGVTFPAKPVIVGRYCFSDPGIEANRENGCLGNLAFDFGERLGDLTLVAEGGGCVGRVLAFGDTSPFQNGAIHMSFGLVARTFMYLSGTLPSSRTWAMQIVLLIAIIGVVAVTGQSWPQAALSLLLLSTMMMWTQSLNHAQSAWKYIRPEAAHNVAMLIQCQHSSMCPWSNTDTGIGGVDYALLRKRMVVLAQPHGFESLKLVRLAFLLDPHKPLSNRDAQACIDFMEAGGSLVVATTYDTQGALHALFHRVGVGLQFDPLGQFRGTARIDDTDYLVDFVAAWPIEVPTRHTAICKAWTRNVIVELTVGGGRLIVVGDGRFFSEKNLEGPHKVPKPANVKFLQDLIVHCMKP